MPAATAFPFFGVTVAEVHDLTPSMRRVTFAGASLTDWADTGWDQRIKLVLPAPDGGYAHLPQGGDQWYRQWLALPDEQRPPIRTYTTRRVRSSDGESLVDIDMVRHVSDGGPLGPAARWLETARPGTRAVLLGPSRSWLEGQDDDVPLRGGIDFVPPARTEQLLLVGDETAAPAIARILEDLPSHARGTVVVELPEVGDLGYVPRRDGFEVIERARDGAAHGELLTAELARVARRLCPDGEPHEVEEIDVDSELLWEVPRHAKGGAALSRTTLYAWLAGEAAAVRRMRRVLVGERGLDRRTVAFMGYWRQGKAEN